MLCDVVPGELLLGLDYRDEAARRVLAEIHERRIDGIVHRGSLLERLHELGRPGAGELRHDVHRLTTAAGVEIYQVNRLHERYAHHRAGLGTNLSPGLVPFAVEPNAMLQLEGPSRLVFDAAHQTYASMIGVPDTGGSTGLGVTVAIVDSGAFGGALGAIPRNFLNLTDGPDEDEEGHGSTIARIIGDIAPDATFRAIKVTRGRTFSAWDALAGVYAARGADVINLSFSFGLQDKTCMGCGFLSRTSRSAVFEAVLDGVLLAAPETIVVVAGGNQGVDDFRFPALFPEAVAVGAVTSGGVRSSRSNYGRRTTDPNADHPNVFYLPGGDVGELIGETDPPSVGRHGTSFAAAYACGLLALYLARAGLGDRSRAATLQHFRDNSDRSMPKDLTDPGNGLMRLV